MRPDGTQHRALSSIDESVPAGPPSLSPNPTDEGRSSSPGSAAPSSPTPSSVSTNNPFEDPRYTLSENGNGGGESIPINTLNNSRSKSGRVNSKRRAQSPPRPLGLPDPVSLDPAAGEARRSEMEQEEGPTVARRWWTDWLCGCREEADEQVRHLRDFRCYLLTKNFLVGWTDKSDGMKLRYCGHCFDAYEPRLFYMWTDSFIALEHRSIPPFFLISSHSYFSFISIRFRSISVLVEINECSYAMHCYF